MDKSPPRELRRAMGKPNATREEAAAWLKEQCEAHFKFSTTASALGVTTVSLWRWRKELGVTRSW